MIQIVGYIISGLFALICALISAKVMSNKVSAEVQQQLVVSQAVTDTKIEELTREVREHNNFAKRIPVVENEIHHIEDDIRILQKYHR